MKSGFNSIKKEYHFECFEVRGTNREVVQTLTFIDSNLSYEGACEMTAYSEYCSFVYSASPTMLIF
jgi:hypothetical protein